MHTTSRKMFQDVMDYDYQLNNCYVGRYGQADASLRHHQHALKENTALNVMKRCLMHKLQRIPEATGLLRPFFETIPGSRHENLGGDA